MSDKMREEFEAWAVKSGYNTKMIVPIAGENSKEKAIYANGQTRSAWQAWQASRAALVVKLPITVCRTHVFELPHTHEVGMEHDEYFEVDDIKKSLDSAGVKYK